MQNSTVIGLILAGGAGSRLGGVDKGLQLYQGKPLIHYVITTLKPQVDELVISINRNQSEYQAFDFNLVMDDKSDYQGPLAGVMAALPTIQASGAQYLLLASCDTPKLPDNYANKLMASLKETSLDVAVAHDGNRSQNLHCLIRCDALTSLSEFYRQGGRALYRWFASNKVINVDFSEQAECFFNINTPEQIDR